MPRTLHIRKPDDFHVHLRDSHALKAVVADTALRFSRALVMPNLKPPVTTHATAAEYRKRILEALPAGSNFQPLMSLYLTDQTTERDILEAKNSGIVFAVKLYPAGATTHSDAGVTNLVKRYKILEVMAHVGLPLLVHGEVTDADVDVFDRESLFIEKYLAPLRRALPELKIVFEHITTREGVDFVKEAGANTAATITAHHLLLSRNAMFQGGIQSHHYCLPILKREKHRIALIEAATSGSPQFFLGTDSAPHSQKSKESACGCAGIYTAHAGIELYAEVFDKAGCLDKLEAFASHFGSYFYGLPRNTQRITLVEEPWTVPATIDYGDERLIPFRAGATVGWRVVKYMRTDMSP